MNQNFTLSVNLQSEETVRLQITHEHLDKSQIQRLLFMAASEIIAGRFAEGAAEDNGGYDQVDMHWYKVQRKELYTDSEVRDLIKGGEIEKDSLK